MHVAGSYCVLVVIEISEKAVSLKPQDVFDELSDADSVVFPSEKVERDSNIIKLHSHNISCQLFQF